MNAKRRSQRLSPEVLLFWMYSPLGLRMGSAGLPAQLDSLYLSELTAHPFSVHIRIGQSGKLSILLRILSARNRRDYDRPECMRDLGKRNRAKQH